MNEIESQYVYNYHVHKIGFGYVRLSFYSCDKDLSETNSSIPYKKLGYELIGPVDKISLSEYERMLESKIHSYSPWQPMDTAPQDRPIMLKTETGLSFAKWHQQPQFDRNLKSLPAIWVWAALVSGGTIPDEGFFFGSGCVLEVNNPIGWKEIPD